MDALQIKKQLWKLINDSLNLHDKKNMQSIDTYLWTFNHFICCLDYFGNIDLICEWLY